MDTTKFEKARIIGARALQISMGAPFILKITDVDLQKIGYNPIEIAKMEFLAGVIPIAVKRPLPKTGKAIEENEKRVELPLVQDTETPSLIEED
jgi:DNA-directed RNA polymerase subunit K